MMMNKTKMKSHKPTKLDMQNSSFCSNYWRYASPGSQVLLLAMCIFGEAQPTCFMLKSHVVFLVSCAKDQDSKPKVPMAPAHFIQKRRFLRRWRFEELLQQDLKNGIVLAACIRGAGHHLEGVWYTDVCRGSRYLRRMGGKILAIFL